MPTQIPRRQPQILAGVCCGSAPGGWGSAPATGGGGCIDEYAIDCRASTAVWCYGTYIGEGCRQRTEGERDNETCMCLVCMGAYWGSACVCTQWVRHSHYNFVMRPSCHHSRTCRNIHLLRVYLPVSPSITITPMQLSTLGPALREVYCLMLCNEEHALSTHPRQLTNHTSGFGSTGKVKTHAPKALLDACGRA